MVIYSFIDNNIKCTPLFTHSRLAFNQCIIQYSFLRCFVCSVSNGLKRIYTCIYVDIYVGESNSDSCTYISYFVFFISLDLVFPVSLVLNRVFDCNINFHISDVFIVLQKLLFHICMASLCFYGNVGPELVKHRTLKNDL